ncbi:MAG: hypothetical protein ACRD5Z_10535 [Bryobacteraceae bacterium]
MLNGPAEVPSRFIATQRSWLLSALPALGLSSAALIYVSIFAGVVALFGLHRRTRTVCESCVEGGSFPPVQGTRSTRIAYSCPADFCRRLALSPAPRFSTLKIASSKALSLPRSFLSIPA